VPLTAFAAAVRAVVVHICAKLASPVFLLAAPPALVIRITITWPPAVASAAAAISDCSCTPSRALPSGPRLALTPLAGIVVGVQQIKATALARARLLPVLQQRNAHLEQRVRRR
jgi:hypothetical protein